MDGLLAYRESKGRVVKVSMLKRWRRRKKKKEVMMMMIGMKVDLMKEVMR